jgi:hypothetical protein
MKVTHYRAVVDGVVVGAFHGNSRIGYSITIGKRAPYLLRGKQTIADVRRFVRAIGDIASEKMIEFMKI